MELTFSELYGTPLALIMACNVYSGQIISFKIKVCYCSSMYRQEQRKFKEFKPFGSFSSEQEQWLLPSLFSEYSEFGSACRELA